MFRHRLRYPAGIRGRETERSDGIGQVRSFQFENEAVLVQVGMRDNLGLMFLRHRQLPSPPFLTPPRGTG